MLNALKNEWRNRLLCYRTYRNLLPFELPLLSAWRAFVRGGFISRKIKPLFPHGIAPIKVKMTPAVPEIDAPQEVTSPIA